MVEDQQLLDLDKIIYAFGLFIQREYSIRAIKGLVWKSSAGWSFLHAYATTIMKFERCDHNMLLNVLHVFSVVSKFAQLPRKGTLC